MRNYKNNLQNANDNFENFWEDKLQSLTWFKKYSKVLNNEDPSFPKWFPGGEINFTYDCLDKHVNNGHGDEIAFIFESYYTKSSTKITYKQLLIQVSKLAGSYAAKGLKKNDKIFMIMPTTLETVVCMLAAVRLGVVYSLVFASYSTEAIASRIEDLQPKLIITANDVFGMDYAIPLKEVLDRAIEISRYKPDYCFIWQRSSFKPCNMVASRDLDLHEQINHGQPLTFVPVEVNEPFFIIYTSGTTGKPKGVVHSVRGVVASVVQDEGFVIKPDIDSNTSPQQLMWNTSNLAWIAGQFAGCYMPLFFKLPSILHEGDMNRVELDHVYRLFTIHKVTSAFISIPNIRSMMAKDPQGIMAAPFRPFSNLKLLSCAGTTMDEPTLSWIKTTFGADVPVIMVFGQTETGGIVTTVDYEGGAIESPKMSVGKPLPGINIKIIRENGSEASPGEVGKIVIKFPLPPSMMSTLLNNDRLFVENNLSNCKNYYDFKDDGKIDSEGYLYVLCRSDSVFKCSGQRISCTGVEEIMMSHSDVAECLVVTRSIIKKVHRGQLINLIPEGFFIVKADVTKSYPEIGLELVNLVHKEIGSFVPLAPPHRVVDFPRTYTGKIDRSIVQQALRDPSKFNEYLCTNPSLKFMMDSFANIESRK